MQDGCLTCGDSYKANKSSRENAVNNARIKVNEEKKSYSVCEDEIEQTYFICEAFEAARNGFKIVQTVSRLQNIG